MIQQVGAIPGPGQNASALDFPSMVRIILSQLTYQDPLKPLDNFQFVTQLAQFSQLQQSQVLNEQITALLASQAAGQATGLLGRDVDFQTLQGPVAGKVKTVSFNATGPRLSVEASTGQTFANVSIADILQVR